MHQDDAKVTPVTPALLREAAASIRVLRRDNERLHEYRNHTERMLALFEGGPRRSGGMVEGEDVVRDLERAANEMEGR